MKKLLTSLLLLTISALASAYDAEVDGFYYNLDPGRRVAEVTYRSLPIGEINWTSDARFGLDGSDMGYACVATFPQDVWERLKTETFYVTVKGDYPGIRITSGWWLHTWTGDDIYPGNERLVNNGDGTWTLSVNLAGDPLADDIDAQDLLITGGRFTLESIYLMGSNAGSGSGEGDKFFLWKNDPYRLETANIPEKITSDGVEYTVTSIGTKAFHYSSNLTTLTIPNSVTVIGSDAFTSCSGLTSLSIPNSVTTIGSSAFAGCSGLTSLTFPNSLTSIGNSAFYNCSGLTSITIPSSVTHIGNSAFEGCNGLTSIKVESGNTVYDSRENCNAIIETSTNTLFVGCQNTIIPNSVTSIGDHAFASCSGLTSIKIPNSVTLIGNHAFSGCSGLASLTIPNSVTTIGNYAFFNCYSLTEVTSLIEEPFAIDKYVWLSVNTYQIPLLYVPADCKSKYEATEGWDVFKIVETGSDCPEQEVEWTERIMNGNLEGEDTYSFKYHYQQLQDSYVVTDPENADNHCIRLVRSNDYGSPDFFISIYNNSCTLYPGQKYKFSMRVKASQPTSMRTQGLSRYSNLLDEEMLGTFEVATEWTTITHEGIVTEKQAGVGQIAFLFSDPSPVEYYFDDVSFMVEMGDKFIAETEEGSKLIFTIISEDEQTCAVGDLPRTDGLHTATTEFAVDGKLSIPQTVEYNRKQYSVKYIGEGAFAGNTKFDNIVIPEGVTYIGCSAFWYSILKSITIPSTVKRFGHQVFSVERYLESVYCYIENPFAIDDRMFEMGYDSSTDTYPWSDATLYVLAGFKKKYETTEGWKNFTNIVEMGTSSGIAIDETNFPDENFRNWVLAQSYGKDGVLTEEEISRIKDIVVQGENIEDLKGIEHFTALEMLNCYGNQLAVLDVSKNTALITLYCSENQLSTLDVSKNVLLSTLDCSKNPLGSLDVNMNLELKELYCTGTQLISLDVTKNTALRKLSCGNNLLTTLDMSKNTALTDLYCLNNRINETEMSKLVKSLPIVNKGTLTVIDLTNENEKNIFTTIHASIAKEKGWLVYAQTNNYFWDFYEGSEPQDIIPIDEGQTIDIGNEIDENTNLEGTVVDNVFVNISNGDGGFDPVEKCIIVNKPTDDSAIDGKDIFGEDFKDNYTGIVFKVNEGKGSIKVEAETQGNMVLKVKIGNNDPIEMELDGKLKVKFPYNVSEETLVYIYGGMSTAGAKATGGTRASADADLLKIYGFEIVSDASGIEATESGLPTDEDAPVYNLNGQRVDSPTKGIYIKNGRKVLVK